MRVNVFSCFIRNGNGLYSLRMRNTLTTKGVSEGYLRFLKNEKPVLIEGVTKL